MCIKHSRSKEVILSHLPLVWSHLEYCVELWAPQRKKDVKVLECAQRRETKLVKRLESMFCEGSQKVLGLTSLVTKRLRDDLTVLCSSLRREVKREVSVQAL